MAEFWNFNFKRDRGSDPQRHRPASVAENFCKQAEKNASYLHKSYSGGGNCQLSNIQTLSQLRTWAHALSEWRFPFWNQKNGNFSKAQTAGDYSCHTINQTHIQFRRSKKGAKCNQVTRMYFRLSVAVSLGVLACHCGCDAKVMPISLPGQKFTAPLHS